MSREVTPRPVDGSGTKRTMEAPTNQPVGAQAGIDAGGSDGNEVIAGLASMFYENAGGAQQVVDMIKGSLGPAGTDVLVGAARAKAAEATSRPPRWPRNVGVADMARVILTRIAPPMLVNPGEIVALQAEKGAVGPPDKATLNVGGNKVEFDLPAEVEQSVTVSVGQSPVNGLNLGDCTLVFDNKWDLVGGVLRGDINLTQWTTKGAFAVEIDGEGVAKAVIEGCELVVGDLMRGTIDIVITPEGLTGTTTILFNDIQLAHGLNLTEGELSVTVDAQGVATGQGTLIAEIPSVGIVTIQAQTLEDHLSGAAQLVVNTPQTLTEGLVLESGELSGTWDRDTGLDVNGEGLVKLQEWAQASISAHYKYPEALWDVNGTLEQTAPTQFGELMVSDSQVDVAVLANEVQELKARGKWTVDHFEGNYDGTYDIMPRLFNAHSTVKMTSPIEYGPGVSLIDVEGEVDIQDNVLQVASGALKAILPYEQENTFQAEFQGTFSHLEQVFEGAGTLETIRDVTIKGENDYRLVIETGATGEVTVSNNDNEKATGQMKVYAYDAQGHLATGGMDFQYENHTWKATGTVKFVDRLLAEVGGATTIKSFVTECEASVEIVDNTFQVIEGEIRGRLEDFDGPFADLVVNGKFDAAAGLGLAGEGQLTLSKDWKLGSAGELALLLAQGGGGVVKLDDNKFVHTEGDFGFRVDGGGGPILEGSVAGKYDGQAGEFSASGATVEVVSDILSVAGLLSPFTLDLYVAYLAYRIWVLEEISDMDVSTLVTSLYDFLRGSFQWAIDALPKWMEEAHGWATTGMPNVLLEMDDWWAQNLLNVGQEAVDWMLDMGEWGAAIIRSAGPKAVEAAGFPMESISDAGAALGDAAAAGWSWV